MMKKLVVLVSLFVGVVILPQELYANGNKESVTSRLIKNFPTEQLQKVQYYLNSTLTLTRKISYDKISSIASGEVSFKDGEYIQEIIISSDTGGELISRNGNILGIGFSANNATRILYFTEEAIGSEYVLKTEFMKSTIKYGADEFKFNKKPKLLCIIKDEFKRDKEVEKETGRIVN
ncbi:MAG: hypothetical protein LBS55_12165 [Prevotellaceae bacterium]|nr:hypothetical protein [Prevotellaceae bacterium]